MTLQRRSMMFAASILPLVSVWVAKVLVWPRPFWVFRFDPEAIYFYGGLSLLRGVRPHNIDNPGTPVQMLSALISAFTGTSPLDYEAFLSITHWLELLFLLLGAATLFFVVLAEAAPLFRIAGVWIYFAAPQALERLDVWSPEVFYLPLGAAALAALFWWWRSPSMRAASATGLLVGLAIATKLVFLPWAAAVVVAMLSARRWRDACVAGASIVAGFLIGTIPIARDYGELIRRLRHLSGSAHAAQSWLELLSTARAWIVGAAIVGVLVAIHRRRGDLPIVVFAISLMLFSVAVTWRNPSFRYLLPMVFAIVALVALILPRLSTRVGLLLVGLTGVLLVRTAIGDVATHRAQIAEARAWEQRVEAAIPPGSVVIYGWRAPRPSFALRVMTTSPEHLEILSRRYPNEGHFDPWEHRIFYPAGARRWDYAVMLDEHRAAWPEPYSAITPVGIGGYVILRR